MPLSIGQVVQNRYRIAALLGQGGMGNIYRAWDLNLKIPIALKENLELSPEAQMQFSEEARLLARLSHPNLPRVTDYFTIPGQGEYLVMDYIEGEDLDLKLAVAQQNPAGIGLPEAQVVAWIIQVCEALSYLHKQSPPVIHRDIKPANIKIDPKGRAVLVDFGIAKRYDPNGATQAGARAVTPGFSPPEQYGGASTDERSDIYAIGATLYTLLTGKEPPESVQRATLNAPPLAPRQVNPGISIGMERTILKAMAVAMEQRYQSADDLNAALNNLNPLANRQAYSSQATSYSPTPPGIGAKPGPDAGGGMGNLPSGAQKAAPVPVEPLRHRTTTAPPAPPSRLASAWPVLLLGGTLLILLILVLARLSQTNQLAERATGLAPSFTPPRPSPTSPIDALLAKQAATQTAAALVSATSPQALTPQATPTIPTYPRRFYDNFNEARGDWFTGIKDNLACWILSGRYTCQVQANSSANHFQWLEGQPLPAQFVLSTNVWVGEERPRGLGDANAGLLFHSSSLGRYLFSIRNDGFYRLSTIQSSPANWIDIIPWTPSPAIQRGQVNRLLVSANGIQYSLFINDAYVASFTNNQWVEGFPGLHLFSAAGDQPTVIEFDNFELRYP